MRTAVSVTLGVLTVLAGAVLVVVTPAAGSRDVLVLAFVTLVAVVGLFGALVQVAGSAGLDDDVAPAPWNDDGALVDTAPERSPGDHRLSGDALAAVVEAAGEAARDDGTVGSGLAVVRSELRTVLFDALVQGGTSRERARAALAEGSWTDDRVAAAVVDDGIARPRRSLRERITAWLFPEQVLRKDVQRAVQAVAEAADRELPPVPGQRAPRTVPVVQPRLEDLRRGADGRLQRAVDPLDVDPAPGELPMDVPEPGEADSSSQSRNDGADGIERGDADGIERGDADGAGDDARETSADASGTPTREPPADGDRRGAERGAWGVEDR